MRLLLIAALSLAFVSSGWADSTSEALALFRDYDTRTARFDVTLADLSSDDAVIRSRRLLPGQQPQELSFRGHQWKAMIRQLMPLAQQRGDRNSFSKVVAKPDGDRVVITSERYSHLKAYTSPFTLVVRKDRSGAWKIIEERSETRP